MRFFCFKCSRLKKRSEDLYRETHACQRQFKKDRILGLMNSIKFCELDEVGIFIHFVLIYRRWHLNEINFSLKKYDQRKSGDHKEQSLESLLVEIKAGVDDLVKESQPIGKLGNHHKNNDLKLIVESYERCCTRLAELSQKSQERCMKKLKRFFFEVENEL